MMAWLNYTCSVRLFVCAILASLAHEAGHYGSVRLLGGSITALRLTAVGALMLREGVLSYGREIVCTLAGPAVNVFLAWISANWGGEIGYLFAGVNLALGFVNLLPFGALDGGRCLGLLAEWRFGPARTVQLCRWGETVLSVGMLLVGGFVWCTFENGTVLILAVWLLGKNLRNLFPHERKKGLSFRTGTGKMIRV
ncbi:MAG: peptidase M50 [Oscillospiraceae bacterium]|nr:peptidase M50 [Oscillospiraceae bacterium]